MSKLMLIDAAHPEQTRVAVVDGNRVEEFDFESRSKKQLRGNIYLAKVTRVEASLQAAFIEYGGNRHGFLSFNEIHPDYYQIPVRDRERLLALEEEEERAAEEAEHEEPDDVAELDDGEEAEADEHADEDTDAAEEAAIADEAAERRRRRRVRELRRYKIQEVIKPGQVLLAQVSKEERGTKGAALTTYLSLAGRYCVLMPNTARGGGVSRKISNVADRKRLKSVIADLDLPKGVGLIIRTAGSKRTKPEIRRDYEYLGRLWSIIREKTLKSIAPALVHEEGGLVRRAVRDLYDKDIEAIHVEGDTAYREAHDFMKMLMPSHASRVKQYRDAFPIFLKHKVEEQLEGIYSPNVRLKSGGYLVIHQTEALVAIDVNSGRSTKERNIEATALKTNLEAADEACRQMRLRDLAGLVVIDFIDMDENKNNRAVEKRMKDALKRDRARIQAGRISGFGLMELSRQRRRASVIEGSSQVCPTCAGLGVVRSVESAALSALQGLEAQIMKGQVQRARLTAPTDVALYLLNEKRTFLSALERDLDMHLVISASAGLTPPHFEVEILERRRGGAKAKIADKSAQKDDSVTEAEAEDNAGETETRPLGSDDEAPRKRRRGRRGGRGRRKHAAAPEAVQAETSPEARPETQPETISDSGPDSGEPAAQAPQAAPEPAPEAAAPAGQEPAAKPRPRRRRRSAKAVKEAAAAPAPASAGQVAPEAEPADTATQEETDKKTARRRPARRRRSAKADTDAAATSQETETAPAQPPAEVKAQEDAPAKPKRRRARRSKTAPAQPPAESAPASNPPAPASAEQTAQEEAPAKPKRHPVRRRRSAEKAAPVQAANTEVAPDASETPEEKASPKRKKRPARRRTAKTPEADAPDSDAPKAPSPKSAQTNTAPQDVEAPEAEPDDKSGGKGKKGWWARKFST